MDSKAHVSEPFHLPTVTFHHRMSLSHSPLQGSTPRIIKLGDSPGCPCGGTHVSNLSDIISMKVHNHYTSLK
jgi:Ser-tRNA(Ala) deacylase AlaX